MIVIAGLGNPGKEYEKTRHNMGYMVLDEISKKTGIEISRKKHNALIGKGNISSEQVMLVKPLTYMNDSGRSLGEILRYYGLSAEDMIVVYDDMDLEPGTIRIRKKGSSGSHNGMRSIISHIGEENFPRVRVGIGRPSFADWKDYVLQRVPEEDCGLIEDGVEKASEATISILRDGIDRAMNRFNTRTAE